MSNKVTYAEIIEALSRETDFSKQKSEGFAKALIGRVKAELEENGKASITNFGSFKVKEVAERQGQNPQTGEPITIPAHNRVSFTPYKALKEKVNAQYAHLESELIVEQADDSGSSENIPEEKEQEEKSFFEREREMEEHKEPANTIFQFDDEVEEEENEQEAGPDKEPGEIEHDDPFAFDELEDEPVPEPDPEVVPEPVEDPEADEDFVFQEEEDEEPAAEEEKGSNMVLILTAAAILAVTLVSVWWFFLRTEPTHYTPQQASVEQPAVTQPNTATENNSSESEAASEQANTETMANAKTSEPEGQVAEEPVESTSEVNSGSNMYEVSQNEWFWVIAEKVYGMSRFWPLIYQENFTTETHPDSLANSTRLEVPQLEGTAENPTKDDYRRLAEASMMVSEAYEKFGRTDKSEEYAKFAKKWKRLGAE